MTNLIEQLLTIENLLNKVVDSDEYRALIDSKYWNPDITLVDALFGVQEAIDSEQLRLEEIQNAQVLEHEEIYE